MRSDRPPRQTLRTRPSIVLDWPQLLLELSQDQIQASHVLRVRYFYMRGQFLGWVSFPS
jgi:hypothetical protein